MDRPSRIVDFVKKFWTREQCPPTIREIGSETGITSTSVVSYYLDKLYQAGRLRKTRRGPAPNLYGEPRNDAPIRFKAVDGVPPGTVVAVRDGKVLGTIVNIGEEDG